MIGDAAAQQPRLSVVSHAMDMIQIPPLPEICLWVRGYGGGGGGEEEAEDRSYLRPQPQRFGKNFGVGAEALRCTSG